MFIHFVVWGEQEDTQADGLAEALVPAVGKCSVVVLQSALFVGSSLRPALVFPEAWNLKVNNWWLSLKAVSGGGGGGGGRTWEAHPQVTGALGRHIFDGCLAAF